MDLKKSIRKTAPTSPGYVPEYLITWLKLLYVSANRVNTKLIVRFKVNPDNEILFSLMDGLRPDAGRRYWIREHSAEVDIVDIGEDVGQMATEVKIALPMSHNA
jgi:hypothetical protein